MMRTTLSIAVHIVGKTKLTATKRNELWKSAEKNGFFTAVFYGTKKEFESDEAIKNNKSVTFHFFDGSGKPL